MLIECSKCGGRGVIESVRHVEDGVCFQCGGTGECEPRKAGKVVVPQRHPEQDRLDWRARYRNARDGWLTYEEMVDQSSSGCGWTHEGIVAMLESLGATKAFRDLGWPV